jgi:hypothetical protein
MSSNVANGGDHMTENSARDESGLRIHPRMRGHLPGPSKVWLASPKLLQTITRTGAHFQAESIADRDCCGRFSSLDVVAHEVLP